jgi:hypothetical protein
MRSLSRQAQSAPGTRPRRRCRGGAPADHRGNRATVGRKAWTWQISGPGSAADQENPPPRTPKPWWRGVPPAMRCRILPAPRTPLQHTTTIRWDGQPDDHFGARIATRNATTGVPSRSINDQGIGVCAGREAEAEGFEPPGGCPPLAFKVVDPAISSDHHSTMARSSTMHGHPWVLPIAGECNHKCNHCGTPLGRPSPAGMLTDERL